MTDFKSLCVELLAHAERAQSVAAQNLWLGDEDEGLFARARAALAEPEPEEPTDEDLWNTADLIFQANCWPTDAIRYARAVLAHWGNPAPTPPADGEVAELVAKLRRLAPQNPLGTADPTITRAAELLERLIPPQPLPVGERPWGREEWCDTDGLCWLGSHALDGSTPTWLFGPPAWAERFPNVHRVVLPAHSLPLPEVGE